MMRDWAHEAQYGSYRSGGDPTDYEGALAQSRVPTLLLALQGDRMNAPAAVDHLARRIGGPVDQKLVAASLAPGTAGFDHFDWARRSPDGVVDLAEHWLLAQNS